MQQNEKSSGWYVKLVARIVLLGRGSRKFSAHMAKHRMEG